MSATTYDAADRCKDSSDDSEPVKLGSAQTQRSAITMSPHEASNRPRSVSASTSSSDDGECRPLPPLEFRRAVNNLYSVVSQMLNLLVPEHDTEGQVASSISAWENSEKVFCEEYLDLSAVVQHRVQHFPTGYSNFLSLPKIQKLHQTTPPAMDQIVCLTNTLLFYSKLFEATNDSDARWNALRGVYIYFPSECLFSTFQEPAHNKSLLVSETAKISLELRTQLTISLFQRNAHLHDFSPITDMSAAFLEEDSPTMDSANLESCFPALLSKDLPLRKHLLDEMTARFKEVQNFILPKVGSNPQQYSVDLEGLMERFPWSAFLLHVARWVQLRQRELTSAISYWCDFHDRVLQRFMEENKQLRRMLADLQG